MSPSAEQCSQSDTSFGCYQSEDSIQDVASGAQTPLKECLDTLLPANDPSEAPPGEGTQESPKVIEVGNPYSGSVPAGASSHYAFVPTETGIYIVTLSGANLETLVLTSDDLAEEDDPTASEWLGQGPHCDERITRQSILSPLLRSGHRYRIGVDNFSMSATTGEYTEAEDQDFTLEIRKHGSLTSSPEAPIEIPATGEYAGTTLGVNCVPCDGTFGGGGVVIPAGAIVRFTPSSSFDRVVITPAHLAFMAALESDPYGLTSTTGFSCVSATGDSLECRPFTGERDQPYLGMVVDPTSCSESVPFTITFF